MKIALLTDGIAPYVTGGMQRHSTNLAKYFTLNGVNVTLVHCVAFQDVLPSEKSINEALFGSDSLNKLAKIVTLRFPQYGIIPGHYIRNSYQYSKVVYESLDFKDVDFVYAKGFTGWYFMQQKKKGVPLPPIGVKFHGYEMFQKSSSFIQKIKAKMLKSATVWNNENADFIFSYGGKITQLIVKEFSYSKDNIWDFTSGIDDSWLNSKEILVKPEVNFVFIGRNEVRKGIKELTFVIEKLLPKFSFKFHFIGPIPLEKRINHQNVIYHGELNTKVEICDVLDKMQVLVCPSHSEGMPNVILEGMARGLAIIATDVGAVEMLVNQSNGSLITPLNVIELENSLIEFIQIKPETLQQKREESRIKVSNDYLWNNLIQRIIERIDNSIK